MSSPVPCIKVKDLDDEYIVFLSRDGQVNYIIRFLKGRRIGNTVRLQDIPWSARWQIEQEMQNFIP